MQASNESESMCEKWTDVQGVAIDERGRVQLRSIWNKVDVIYILPNRTKRKEKKTTDIQQGPFFLMRHGQ